MSKTLISTYRKEVAESRTMAYQGQGQPRKLVPLTPEQIKVRQEKIATYDAWLQTQGKRTVVKKWGQQLNDIKANTQAIMANTTAIKDDTTAIRNALDGEEIPRKQGQTDKNRLKQLRLQKRGIDNEISDLREREQKRISNEKHESIEKVQQAAEIAQGNVQLVEIQDEATLTQQYQAQKKVIKEKKKNEKAAERKANPKAKGKGKGKNKSKASPKQETENTEKVNEKAEEDARLKAEEDARLKAEEDARLKAEEDARLKAEEDARLKAEEDARLKAEEDARLKAEEDARLKAQEDARLKSEEAKAKAKSDEDKSESNSGASNENEKKTTVDNTALMNELIDMV
jgi:hypothetical protein